MSTYQGHAVVICDNCGDLLYSDTGEHVHDSLITRECDATEFCSPVDYLRTDDEH